jgi:hypothetical protein
MYDDLGHKKMIVLDNHNVKRAQFEVNVQDTKKKERKSNQG